MAQQDLVFRSAARPKDWVTRGRAYTFSCSAWSSGTQQTPSAAVITIRKPGGDALATPVVDAAMTIDGSGDMTYSLVSGNTGELGTNYSADVEYTVSGTTYDGRFLFDVCGVPLHNVVLQADLIFHHPDLADLLTSGESNMHRYLTQAFEDVCTFLDGKGNRPYLVLNSEALRRPIEYRALEKFFFARQKTEDDRWGTYAATHANNYAVAIQALGNALVYDLNQSGTADGTGVDGKAGEEGSRNTGFRFGV